MNGQISDIVAAHKETLEMQKQMNAAASRRAELVRAAMNSGVSVVELAAALGVHRQRIYAMAR